MKKSNGLFWGVLLILTGTLWLLRTMGYWLHIDWYGIMRYWPILLILSAGRQSLKAMAIVLAVIGLLAGVSHQVERGMNIRPHEWKFDWEDDQDTEEYLEGDQEINGHYDHEMDQDIDSATFNLEGGAGSFEIKQSTGQLFEASTRTHGVSYQLNVRQNKLEKQAVVDLKAEDETLELKNIQKGNHSVIKLNQKPVWDLNLNLGAGKGDFDLSSFKIRNLTVNTGVTDLDIKLGSAYENSAVSVESGVSAVTLAIPRETGCEVRIDDGITLKDLDGMDKIEDGLYRSPDFGSSPQKIMIHFNSGVSKLKIKRY